MAPIPLRRLIAVQNSRKAEIELTGTRIRARERNTLNKNIVQSRIEAVKTIWHEARQTHADIVARDDSAEDAYVVNNEFARMQGVHDDTLDYLLTLLSEFEALETRSSRSWSPDNEDDEKELRPAKLPKLDLPTFSGQYEDWASFADLFTTLVHNAPRIANVTKLQYLKSCLRGSAAALVKNVATTNANYESTWRALETHFCKPRLSVSQHLDALLNISRLKRASAADLQAFTGEARQIVKALGNLKMPIDYWDIWLIHILSARLDDESQKEWESYLSNKDRPSTRDEDDLLSGFPKFGEFTTFLEKRIETLTMLAAQRAKENKFLSADKPESSARRVHYANASQSSSTRSATCALCSGPHYISKCTNFLKNSAHERKSELRRLRLCFNCMGRHWMRECTSKGRCGICRDKHHSLIHCTTRPESTSPNTTEQPSRDEESTETPPVPQEGLRMYTATVSKPKYCVILATARVKIVGPNGSQTRVRALLDQGAEASFVSESIAQLLGLPRRPVDVALSGLGASATGTARAATRLKIRSLQDSEFNITVNAFILPRLTSKLPTRDLQEIDLEQFSRVPLADPRFYQSEYIDLIVGADIYGTLLRTGLRRFPSSQLVAQNTALGWIISGPLGTDTSRRAEHAQSESCSNFHCALNEDLHEMMQRFWEVEDIPQSVTSLKPEDEACERLFMETHTRDTDGRYVVKLPLKAEPPRVANETRCMALRALANMHRRFLRDPQLASEYTEFMGEYERSGHMTRVPPEELDNPLAWYLPHHAVMQSSTTKRKIRVVFDASRRTSEQYCLNDFFHPALPCSAICL